MAETRMPARGRRLHMAYAAAVACAVLLGACGGGGGNPGTRAVPIGSTQPAPAITLLAGDAVASGATDGVGGAARFNGPAGLALDGAGNVYVADQFNDVIRKITPAGQVSTFAGAPGIGGSADGNAGDARFAAPSAIAIDGGGNLFVTDGLNIRKITPAGVVSTIATIALGNNIEGSAVTAFVPAGIAVDAADNLYITNGLGTRELTPSGATTVLEGVASADNLTGTYPLTPRGIAVDASGNVYVAALDDTIDRVNPGGGLVLLAGTALQPGSADGVGAAARFQQVVALTIDHGNLYAADGIDNTLRKITMDGVVTTVAGTVGAAGLQTGPLPGSLASLRGAVADGKGTLYASSGNAVVKITLP